MKIGGRESAAILMAILALIPMVNGIQITASGGGGGESGSVAMNIEAANEATVNSELAINGADITPATAMSGPIPLFEQTHGVTDAAGKKAQVYVKVVNAQNGLTYTSKVLPSEGSVSDQPWVSAEQWLTVPMADSIKCTASASTPSISADVGLEETKGPLTSDFVTLNGYYGRAYSSTISVSASQTATDGSASSIMISGQSNGGSVPLSVNTQLDGLPGGNAALQRLNAVSSAGDVNVVTQTGHAFGVFTSTATAGTLTKTRTSNYGNEYDISMAAIGPGAGPSVAGVLGYYVNPTSAANKIQDAVNAAESGDTINVAAGTYKENVFIDKSLAVIGASRSNTIVDGNRNGSVFFVGGIDPNIDVTLSTMTIRNGSAGSGGGIYNNGRLTVKDSTISGNSAGFGGGIRNSGYFSGTTFIPATLTVQGSAITGNSAVFGGGIENEGTMTVKDSSISQNTAITPGIATGSGGGIYNFGTATVMRSTVSGNTVNSNGGGIRNSGYFNGTIYHPATLAVTDSTISGNFADNGGGIENDDTATVTNSVISGNTASNFGGGIRNSGFVSGSTGTFIPASLAVTGSTISSNRAKYGGGIENEGTATVTNSKITGNTATVSGGGIYNFGTLTLTGDTISGNTAASIGGGMHNEGTATVMNNAISGNAASSGGGIGNIGTLFVGGTTQITNNRANPGWGGGIYSTTNSITFDGTGVAVKFNRAHEPFSQPAWYQGWGVYVFSTTPVPTTTGGFNPATQVTGNTHI